MPAPEVYPPALIPVTARHLDRIGLVSLNVIVVVARLARSPQSVGLDPDIAVGLN